jgi:transcriptional regulator with XRE-family HTH domain
MTEDTNHEEELRTGNEPALETMGGRIRAVRKARRLKINLVAPQIGLSRTSFSMWESNRVANPDVGKLRRFSSLVDVSLDWLIDRKGKDPDFLAVSPTQPKKPNKKTQGAQSDQPSDSTVDIPEIAPSLDAHAKGIDFTARHYWSLPIDVLELGFNCNAGSTVVKRVVTRDGHEFGIARGDYVLIDTSRARIDEPGLYIIADPDGVSARRALADLDKGELHITIMADDTGRDSPQDNGDNPVVLGRVMGIFKPA